MTYSRNEVDLIGNVGNIKIEEGEKGNKFARLSIATNRRWKEDGNTQERTDWHNVVIFQEHTVDFVEKYLTKGRRVNVRGRLDYYDYENSDLKKVYVTQVVASQLNVLDAQKGEEGSEDAS